MFKEICKLIEERTGFHSPTLQVGHRVQGAPQRCVLISESAGGGTNFYCPDMADINIQLVTRAKRYFDAREDAWIFYQAFHGTAGWNIPRLDGSGEDYLAMTVEAIAVPQYIGQDMNGLFEFSVNFIFRMEEASCGG